VVPGDFRARSGRFARSGELSHRKNNGLVVSCDVAVSMVEHERLHRGILPMGERDNCLGSPTARYSLVEYGDYSSPQCREVAGTVSELVKELPNDLCFVFRNFPQASTSSRSRAVAEAAEAAGLQGKFWMMHDRIFSYQGELSDKALRDIARGLPIEMADFERDLSSGVAARRVGEDLETGAKAGVAQTPTFFANGTVYTGSHEFLPMLKALQAGAKPTQ
jgi:protein-disulfide isomerase